MNTKKKTVLIIVNLILLLLLSAVLGYYFYYKKSNKPFFVKGQQVRYAFGCLDESKNVNDYLERSDNKQCVWVRDDDGGAKRQSFQFGQYFFCKKNGANGCPAPKSGVKEDEGYVFYDYYICFSKDCGTEQIDFKFNDAECFYSKIDDDCEEEITPTPTPTEAPTGTPTPTQTPTPTPTEAPSPTEIVLVQPTSTLTIVPTTETQISIPEAGSTKNASLFFLIPLALIFLGVLF
ncbi:MAG: hypothetical protein N2482_00570 [Patescibacteria group bacterium]|nr:hypothetical protein [Patescibacteria group bacterium]